MRKCAFILASIGAFWAGMSAAHAVTTFDTTLANPPGVYFGSGNQNVHWTVNTKNGTELGLQAVTRFIGPITPDVGTGTYQTPAGDTTVPGKTGSIWGFVFSLNEVATAGANLANTILTLTLTDVANGTTGSFNPLLIPDDSRYGPNGLNSPLDTPATQYGAQNSETLSFAAIAAALLDPGYSSSRNDSYIFTLSAICTTCTIPNLDLGSVSITVDVGEPASFLLFGLGLAGLRVVRTKKARTSPNS